MPVTLAPVPHMQFFDSAGNPLSNGKVFTFQAGTSTPLATYTDSTGGTPNANPIILDAAGFANIWLTNNIAYKFQVQNSAGVTQWTVDNVVALGSSTINPQKQIFTSGGTFTIPTTSVKVTVVGGGGAGGGSAAATTGGGGGSGGTAIKWLSGLTPGNTLTVAVGAAGTGVSAAAGNVGTASSVASGTQIITTITVNGGAGGNTSGAPAGGGAGAVVGSGGDVNLGGNAGQVAYALTVGGTGSASPMLGGAPANSGGGLAGNPASSPGAGGGGGAGGVGNTAGGAGAAGIVIFEWVA